VLQSTRIRRSKCLIAFWDGDEFVFENYVTGRQTRIHPAILELIRPLESYDTVERILGRWDHVPEAPQLLQQLVNHNLMIVEGSHLDEKENLIEADWAWDHDARFYHYSTNAIEFECDPDVQRRDLSRRALEHPPPSPYRDHNGWRIALNRRFEERSGEFWEALYARRTCRSFSGQPINEEDFVDVLMWTWGQTRAVTGHEMGDYVLKTSPSGGARHPIEVYPVVLAVRGIESGIYHYSVRHNALTLLRQGAFADLVVDLSSDQRWLRNAAAVFFMTAVVQRSMWKYRHSHAYRVLNLDAGHVGQTFHLVCTRLGLGPFTTAATRNRAIERELGLDGVSEIVIYTAAVGVPA
jgi:SagB-type dehydrogenase family enzyme